MRLDFIQSRPLCRVLDLCRVSIVVRATQACRLSVSSTIVKSQNVTHTSVSIGVCQVLLKF